MSNEDGITQHARKYIRWGWRVVPIPSRKKAPIRKEWTKLRISESDVEEYFDENSNIGVLLGKPSHDLVDVDLDCPESIFLAPFFLPATRRIHGRKSAKNSHYWYHVKQLLATIKFQDTDGGSIAEIRSTGLQTVVPPSIHPTGERLRWSRKGKAARVTPDDLLHAVRRLAACSLIARHWPDEGSRNDAALALAGVLLRGGWDEKEASKFISLAAQAAHDEECEARRLVAKATRHKLDKKARTTGRPRLAQIIGTDVVNKVCEWLGIDGDVDAPSHTRDSVPHRPKLGEKALYGLAGDIVRVIEPETEADPAALLLQMLVAFGNCIGPRPFFEMEATKHGANLFCLIVGRSSKSRKGTAWAHVLRIFKRVDPCWSEEHIATGLSTGEGLIWSVRDPVPEKKKARSKKHEVGEEVVDVPDKRVLVLQPEFASVLRVQRREGNTLSAVLRSAWESGTMGILTKNSPAKATGAYVSIIGHITEDELRRELTATDEANGYANRFLFGCAERSKLLPLGGCVDELTLSKLVQRLVDARRFARNAHQLQFTEKAEKLWIKRYPRLSREIPGLLGAITSRSEAQVLRLAMLYALVDRSREIKTQHLRAALSLWRYCEHSARYIFGAALGDRTADRILEALRAKPKGLSRNDIRELFKRNLDESRIDRALRFLRNLSLVRSTREQTAGRPREHWTTV